MKKYIFFQFLVLVIIGLSIIGFTNNDATKAIDTITTSFHNGMEQLETNIQQFNAAVEQLDGSESTIVELQQTHLNNRAAFKAIEYLLEYYDRQAIVKYINGAPLPKTEPKVPEVNIIQPKGLQVLDELVFSDDPLAEKEAIAKLGNKLAKSYKEIKAYQSGINLTHRHIFEAVRQELVRVLTLGVTGFDTPGSANAIPEALVAMESISTAMSAYYPLIAKQDKAVADQMETLFAAAQTFLAANNDFENFDRLTFTKDYINPLYGLTYKAHIATGIETVDEVNPLPLPFNYHATDIFSDDFLNPAYFAETALNGATIDKRVALGRLLFFDPILSSTNEGSCASCHQPGKAFTDGQKTSLSMTGDGNILRNSPTLINSIYAEKYFYDLREINLEKQTKHVIFDKNEFSTDFAEIMNKLKQSETYKKLFAEAYKDHPQYSMSPAALTNALAMYVAQLRSFNSPLDQYIRGEIADLNPSAKRGYNLFMGKAACGTCHFAPTFNGTVPPIYQESESEVLGVPTTNDTINVEIDPDKGRIANELPRDKAYFYEYSFKTTTVRNAALTAPYMHNGVYNTLEEVVDFYNRGGGAGMGIEGIDHQTLPFDNLQLTKQEQADLVAFMEALTDNPFVDEAPDALPAFEGKPEWNKRYQKGAY